MKSRLFKTIFLLSFFLIIFINFSLPVFSADREKQNRWNRLLVSEGNEFKIYHRGSISDVETFPEPAFLAEGGMGSEKQAFIDFLKKSKFGDLVIFRQADNPEPLNEIYGDAYGKEKPNSVRLIYISSREASENPEVLKAVKNAEAIYFYGGDQADYVKWLEKSPLLALLKERIAHGIPIGGISAGAAILGEYCYTAMNEKNGKMLRSYEALKNPLSEHITLLRNFLYQLSGPVIMKGIITETHLDREEIRNGRIIAFLAHIIIKSNNTVIEGLTGIGLEEGTSVLIDGRRNAKVYGSKKHDDCVYFYLPKTVPDTGYNNNLSWNAGNDIQAVKVRGTPNGENVFSLNAGKMAAGVSLKEYSITVSNGRIHDEYPPVWPYSKVKDGKESKK